MSSPTPIAFCITDLDPGGAERALVQIVTRLDRVRWEPVVYCLGRRGALADVLEEAGIETHCLNAGTRDLLVIVRLSRLLRKQRPALLQTFLFHANIAGRIAAWLAGVPIVVSGVRVAEREKRWHLWLDRWTKSLATHHVAVSGSVAEFTRRVLRVGPERVSVIANGVDAERCCSAPPADLAALAIPAAAATLLFVGRLERQKGVHDLLLAVAELVKEGRDVHLVMIGTGPLAEREQSFAGATGLNARVHWLGSRRDVASFMRSATLLVLPSLWEGMPNVVLEAMAAGLPVVATNVDGTAEVVTDGATGWLAAPGDFQSLARAIGQAVDSPGARNEVASQAQLLVRERFRWDSAVENYERLWRMLLEVR